MISTGLGNLMTQVLMLAFGLILLVPCAYKAKPKPIGFMAIGGAIVFRVFKQNWRHQER